MSSSWGAPPSHALYPRQLGQPEPAAAAALTHRTGCEQHLASCRTGKARTCTAGQTGEGMRMVMVVIHPISQGLRGDDVRTHRTDVSGTFSLSLARAHT